MAMKRLHLSSLLAIAPLMLGSVSEARKISHVYRMCDPSVPNKMPLTSNMLPVHIQSTNYGSGVYHRKLNCSFHLDSGHEPLVLLFEFKKFELEYHRSCMYDFLCVHGVKFCGNWTQGKEFRHIIPRYSGSTIIFRTDLIRQYSGFDVIVSARKAIDNEVVLEPVGIGSSEKHVSYVNVAYNSWMLYEDKCLMSPGRSTTTARPTTTTEPPTTTNEPQTPRTEPPLELPLHITVRPTSATKEPFECNCRCTCTPSSK